MIVEKRQRTMFRAVRRIPRLVERNGKRSISGTTEQSRWFLRAHDAYNWIAVGFVLRIRAHRSGIGCFASPIECDDCERTDMGTLIRCCEWHQFERFTRIRARVARLLRHYDELKRVGIPSPSPEGMRAVETLQEDGRER